MISLYLALVWLAMWTLQTALPSEMHNGMPDYERIFIGASCLLAGAIGIALEVLK